MENEWAYHAAWKKSLREEERAEKKADEDVLDHEETRLVLGVLAVYPPFYA